MIYTFVGKNREGIVQGPTIHLFQPLFLSNSTQNIDEYSLAADPIFPSLYFERHQFEFSTKNK